MLAQQPAQHACESFTTITRAWLRSVRISDETEFSVLNRKCGLIWLVSAARRASTSSRCCSSSFFSLRVLFQIFSGMRHGEQRGRVEGHDGQGMRVLSARVEAEDPGRTEMVAQRLPQELREQNGRQKQQMERGAPVIRAAP